MKLSVIIVNYNVKYFLEQALLSTYKAIVHSNLLRPDWEIEVYVVDNHSIDGSVELTAQKFPQAILIANQENAGFSKANNQAIRMAKGEYILLLNPDTVMEEDTLYKCLLFMEAHPDAGGLGVKMIDGKGQFLPESKRGLPTPWVALCKLTGLSALFPKSPLFNHYHLGHLSPDDTHEVEILSGAFMFMRKKTLDKCGLLDEDFFMYGEDVDLSYRIILSGYKNYYYAGTRIIHYKGESTKKGSLNYVKMFYHAMALFAVKHFGQNRPYILFIKTGIFIRATLTLLLGFIKKTGTLLTDAALLFAGMLLIKIFWEHNIKADVNLRYPPSYLYINIPLYVLIWIATLWISGAYDKRKNYLRIATGILMGSLIIAAIYGFLNESFRSSRAHILAGTLWALLILPLWRLLYTYLTRGSLSISENHLQRIVIAGDEEEVMRVRNLLNQSLQQYQYAGYFGIERKNDEPYCLGRIEDLSAVLPYLDVNEIIFCAKNMASSAIFNEMSHLGNAYNYKIVPAASIHIIGSNSKNTAGDLYTLNLQLRLQDPFYRRQKRILDLAFSLFLIPAFPFLILIGRYRFLILWMRVVSGRMTWVGYNAGDHSSLPKLNTGVWTILQRFAERENTAEAAAQINFQYARDYSPYTDMAVIWRNFWRGNTFKNK